MLLMVLLAVIAVVLVLPQIDLQALACYKGTSPLVVHARVTSAPLLLIAVFHLQQCPVVTSLLDSRAQSPVNPFEAVQTLAFDRRC